MRLYGKFPALEGWYTIGEISGSQKRDSAKEGWPSSRINENKFWKEFNRDAGSQQRRRSPTIAGCTIYGLL